jgi:hypothetical protein
VSGGKREVVQKGGRGHRRGTNQFPSASTRERKPIRIPLVREPQALVR